MDKATLISILSVAFFSSIGHCIGMCGGFMVALSILVNQKNKAKNIFAIVGYNAARVSAYVLLGALFGAFGSFFALSLKVRGYFLFIIGVFLVILGIALIKRGKILNFLEGNSALYKFINLKIKMIISKNMKFGFLMLGFLNGFMPCGVVYYFLAIAISTGSAINGALVMAIFGMVSLVMMSSYALILKFLNDKFRNFMLYLSGLVVIIYGIYISFIGFMATNG
ncbi:sulfite exporter TauE/SafE family protein [Campylobacter sp. RM16192]|uniref:sulfite exporter TauE/SafE family protein n=1 Tax=Campylobacter sp. RM16192 TaxID=1660080 RepID=UPI001451395E|nr:sulfite exporter TauE/SafE family protein [Campylobacter sp. RM16192]QCD51914.1 putative membrane protein (DsbD domain) [Campylobacter sp. RM16192]